MDNCPTCGRSVPTIFEHVDVNCEEWPYTLDTIFDYLNDREARPYEWLRRVATEPVPEVEVTEEVFDHFLNILPPALLPGGFYVIERVTDETVSSYWKRGDHYFHRYIDTRSAH